KAAVAAEPDAPIASGHRLHVEIEIDIVLLRPVYRAYQRRRINPCSAMHGSYPDLTRSVFCEACDHIIRKTEGAIRLVLQQVYVGAVKPEKPRRSPDPQKSPAVL